MPNRINTKSKINMPDDILIKIIGFSRHFSKELQESLFCLKNSKEEKDKV